jgi:hypothetical protein
VNRKEEQKDNLKAAGMKKLIITMILLALVFPNVCYSRNVSGVPVSVTTPRELAEWLSCEFSYRMELRDDWQTPRETIRSRQGDCEDFAILVSTVLSRQGIANDLITVYFKDLPVAHAICMWKENDGTYSFMSNKKLYRSRENSIRNAIRKYYPDWEKIAFVGPEKKVIKTVRRT